MKFSISIRVERRLLDLIFTLDDRELVFEFKTYGKHLQVRYFNFLPVYFSPKGRLHFELPHQ